MKTRIFYGWWIVAACLGASLVGNALGLFGAGVYLHAAISSNGWSSGIVSGAVTLFYIVSAVLLMPVGSGISRFGPQPFIAAGALALAVGVAGVGRATQPWQIYLAFPVMGIGWACLCTTAIAITLAPWFEKYQGRAISIASLGASAGGMIGPPLLLTGIGRMGFAATTSFAGGVAVVVLLPLAIFILRHRPEDMGLQADGAGSARRVSKRQFSEWSRIAAMRTPSLRTTMIAFGLGMLVQIGFLTYQVTILSQSLAKPIVAMTVSVTAATALVGRLALVKFADRVDARATSFAVLVLASMSFCAMTLVHGPLPLMCASAVFGLTVGNITTLSPIIVRREFGAAAFGRVFGVASCAIQLAAALGPSFFGFLYDFSGSYREPLLAASILDVLAAWIILSGRKTAEHATSA